MKKRRIILRNKYAADCRWIVSTYPHSRKLITVQLSTTNNKYFAKYTWVVLNQVSLIPISGAIKVTPYHRNSSDDNIGVTDLDTKAV